MPTPLDVSARLCEGCLEFWRFLSPPALRFLVFFYSNDKDRSIYKTKIILSNTYKSCLNIEQYMKRILFVFLVVLGACRKDGGSACEKWEYYDVCTPKRSDVHCMDYGHQQGQICGDQLKDAKAGKTTIVAEDENRIETRHYVKKL